MTPSLVHCWQEKIYIELAGQERPALLQGPLDFLPQLGVLEVEAREDWLGCQFFWEHDVSSQPLALPCPAHPSLVPKVRGMEKFRTVVCFGMRPSWFTSGDPI